MLNLTTTLEYLRSVTTAHLGHADSQEVISRIEAIEAKRRDSKLYLAVIGEFSSGKSTFINALLGFRLLKEAVTPTTACATYIECHAPKLSLTVSFFDGKEFEAEEKEVGLLADYLRSGHNVSCQDLQEIVTVLTSHQQVARTVAKLHIRVPGEAIPRNIVIIDTPGFNPGSSTADNHHEITREVVENIADAAIILTPQEQAMSATLSRFLKENLARCLHRCTYVVTKLDIPDEATGREILEYAATRVTRDLRVENPRLHGVSAVTMLPVRQIPPGKEAEWPRLKDEFARFVSSTWAEMSKNKDLVLAEHIHTLVKDTADMCEQRLIRKQAALHADKQFLEEHGVATIQSVCERMVDEADRVVNQAFASLDISLGYAEGQCVAQAEQIINHGTLSKSSFQNRVMPQIVSMVDTISRNGIQNLYDTIGREVRPVLIDLLSEMGRVFTSHYSSFPSLQPPQDTSQVTIADPGNVRIDFREAFMKISELDRQESSETVGAAAAGAGIGFLVGGPLGAVIGGGIGWFCGAGEASRSNQMKAQATPAVTNEIHACFSRVRSRIDDEVGLLRERYLSMIKDYANRHIAEYGEAVESLINEHRDKVADLDRLIKSLRNAILGLQNLRDDVELQLAMLKVR